jgi:hypothetical protein
LRSSRSLPSRAHTDAPGTKRPWDIFRCTSPSKATPLFLGGDPVPSCCGEPAGATGSPRTTGRSPCTWQPRRRIWERSKISPRAYPQALRTRDDGGIATVSSVAHCGQEFVRDGRKNDPMARGAQHPDAPEAKTSGGLLPLHLAVLHGGSFEKVQYLARPLPTRGATKDRRRVAPAALRRPETR